ncbi:MAG: hypothetical protein ACLVL7_08900 [Anaerotruncus massiliensis (ex Togo et al. 2019)]
MKPLAVASCWQVPNYGSVLQAYATQAALDSLGVPNETLWYEPERSLPEGSAAGSTRPASGAGSPVGGFGARSAPRPRAAAAALRRGGARKFARNICASPPLRQGALGAVPGYERSLGGDRLGTPPTTGRLYTPISSRRNPAAWAASFGGHLSVRSGGQPPGSSAGSTGFPRGGVGPRADRSCPGGRSARRRPGPAPAARKWRARKPAPLPAGGYLLCYFLGRNPAHREFAARLRRRPACPSRRFPPRRGRLQPTAVTRTSRFTGFRREFLSSSTARPACSPTPTTARRFPPSRHALYLFDRFCPAREAPPTPD